MIEESPGCIPCSFLRLLRSPEEAAVDRFPQNVPLNCLHHVSARLESVRRWFDVQLCIERIQLEYIMVQRAVRGGARSAIHRARGADLKAPVGQLRALWHALR